MDDKDNSLQANWRPILAYTYMLILLFDFVFGPIFWGILQSFMGVTTLIQWAPLTLLNGGLLHATLGGVLGISAWTRGREKIERIKKDGE